MIVERDFKIGTSEIHLIDINLLDMDDLSVLKNHEYDRFMAMKANKRRKEFLGARILLNEIQPSATIEYKETGKPKISTSQISISHSSQYVAIGLNRKYDIGIDLQQIKTKIDNIKDKFLSELELHRFNHDPNTLTELWCIKEACYKLFDESMLNFKQDIDITMEKGEYIANCKVDQKKFRVPFYIFTFEGFKLAINTTEAEQF